MKKITEEEIAKSVELYKWISPTLNPASKIWNKGDEIRTNCIYKFSVERKVQAIWADFDNLQEPHFIRIYKKINILPHEFFLFHMGKKTRIGWRINNQIKL